MTNSDSSTFRLGITRDCLTPDGDRPNFADRAFAVLDAAPGLTWEFLPTFADQITPADAARYDAILSLRPELTAVSLAGSDIRLKLLARLAPAMTMSISPPPTARASWFAMRPMACGGRSRRRS